MLALVAAAAVPWVQARVDRALGDLRAQNEVLYLWKGSQVKRLVPGFEHLAADIYWLRTVQYFGGERIFATDKKFDLLYPLIEITTTLDPRMEIAYRYGAMFLAEPFPIGAGRPDLGVAVLERGRRRTIPASWRLRQELGFFHFVYRQRRDSARREILVEASQIPGAAFWLKNLAAELLGKGGERSIARRMWQEMFEQSEGAIKENARVHLLTLDALDAVDAPGRAGRGCSASARDGCRGTSASCGRGARPRGRSWIRPASRSNMMPETGKVAVSRTSYLRREDLMGETR